jgi:hypothetical protein
MIKYRLSFVMPGEVLFGLLAKVLPIEDLSVEEIAPTPAKLKAKTAPQLVKPKMKREPRAGGYAPNLEAGTNATILKVLADGQVHRTREIKEAFVATGYNPNGTGSTIERLRKWGLIRRVGAKGQWQLTEEQKKKQSA